MPEVRSADWSTVKFRCQVIARPDQATVRVQVESREIDLDEEVSHWDYLGARNCALIGKQISMRAACLPAGLDKLNSVFWIAHDNAIIPTQQSPKRYVFREESDTEATVGVATEEWKW